MRRPIGIDLFSGAGGLSLGFEWAGFDVAVALDIDPIHCATHKFNFPHCETICSSVTQIDGKEIRRRAKLGGREIDVVFGGAPCQGFSLIGKRTLEDPRNQLLNHFVRLVVELEPRFFVFENVKGLLIGKHRRFLEELIKAFSKGGYQVGLDYKVLNASDYGVPQNRQRLFLFGVRKGGKLPEYPRPIPGVTVLEAIGDLPEVENFTELLEMDWVHTSFGKASSYGNFLRGKAKRKGFFGYERRFNRNILTSSLRTEHTPLSRKRFAKTAQGEIEPVSRFHKLDPNGICNTLRAGTASDRGAFTSPRPIHPFSPRCITVREAARLHSYPDWFRFHTTKWHGFRQIRNSVPPLLAHAVASEIMLALGKKPLSPDRSIDLGDSRLLSLPMAKAAELFGVPATVIPQRIRRDSNLEKIRA